jgi:hypothetical protein
LLLCFRFQAEGAAFLMKGMVHGVWGSVTKPIFCTPARCAVAKASATRS